MQVAAIDLSKEQELGIGDSVEVFLRRTTAGRKLPRVYVLGEKVKGIRIAGKYTSVEYQPGED